MNQFEQWLQADILSLGMAADEARRAAAGGTPVVTYVRVQAVAARDLGSCGPVPPGASEVRLYETPASLEEAVAQTRALRAWAGGRRVAAYSMADLEERSAGGWGALDLVLSALARAGLSDVAEMPVDRLADVTASLRAAVGAGLQPRRLTVSRPLGDRPLEILDRMRACRSLQPTPLHVAPLPRQIPQDKPTTGYEDLRLVALARLMFGADAGAATRIEVDWGLYGPKLAQVALTFGADHLDSVSAVTDDSLGPRRGAVADVERNIRAAGFEPRETRLPS